MSGASGPPNQDIATKNGPNHRIVKRSGPHKETGRHALLLQDVTAGVAT
jgi:hypothetical protein